MPESPRRASRRPGHSTSEESHDREEKRSLPGRQGADRRRQVARRGREGRVEAKSLNWYGPLVDLVVRSSRSVRSGKPVDKAALTAELVKLEGVVKK